MKKILLSAAALLTLLFAASCQKEDFSGADGEFATVTLTVQAPASPVTKAFGDGTNTNLRLDFGVFDENGEVLDALRQTDIEFGAADSEGKRSTTVKVNLAKGKTYHFVCWAQDNSLDCYNHTDLKAITVDYSKNNTANEEKRDAFYACVKSDIVKADYTQTITLTRPFAQLNVGSDDLKEAEKAGLDTTKLYVELRVTNCPNVLNADFAKQSYTVAGSVEATFTKAICPATVVDSERINVELNGTPKSYSWLSMNYIFTSVNKDDLKEVTFKLYEEDTLLDTYTKDNVPFQANWRTNLLGRLLTTDGELTVVIDPNFANVHNIYLDAISQAALQTAIANKVAGTYNVSGYVHAVAAVGTDQEKVTLKDDKDDANPTVTKDYTLSVVGLKSDDTFYQAGDYLVVSVTVDADGKDTCAEKHLYHRPAKADDEEVVEPVTPELSLAMEATEPVPADGGKVTVKVTSNVAWTLSLNGSKVAEGSEAVADHEVEVVVPANGETQEVTHTLVLSDVPAEGATATTKTVEIKQAAAEAEPEITITTVADFLAASVATDVYYTLKGTITSVANTTYGNFDLTDDTGTVYIYGLMSEDGTTNKYWATSGAKLGDDIVISVPRDVYNGTPQGKNAHFIELISPGTRAFYTLSTEVVDFASTGGEQVVAVTAYNTDAAVTASSDNEKFTVSVDGYNVTISSAANEHEEAITGNVTVKVGDLTEVVVKVSLAAKPASGVVEGGKADFNTISDTSTSYVEGGETTAGWAYTNCAIFKGGTSNSSPSFTMIGDESNRALCMNGKTSAQGTITSPILKTGCGILKFNYGLPFSDTKIKFTVDIIQNGEIVKTFTVDNSSATKLTKYSFEETINVAGEFQIIFKNLSPSNYDSNKDRTAVWDVEWTGF